MPLTGIAAVILIIVTVLFSWKGFNNTTFFEGYKFEIDRILVNKDYKRILTSGFLHLGWMHLAMNMISLFLFSHTLESSLGELSFLLIYFASLTGGSLFALFIHRHHGDYSAVGASGAVCGVIFAAIALSPGMYIGFFGLPIPIPAWLFGLVYVLYSIYGIRSKKENVGHDAHLGGAMTGMIVALLMQPAALVTNYVTILIITIPACIFIYLIITRPHMLIVNNQHFKKHHDFYDIDQKYNFEQSNRQQELDLLLDKISRKGIESLSKKEKEKLKEYSGK